jgi:hypothetical protein
MLMLVVVIIIAAVVSGFAGTLIRGSQKAPSLALDLQIVNSGNWADSFFRGTVTSTNEPISTHDLKIVTSWTKKFINGTVIYGGATTSPGVVNENLIYDTHGGSGYDLWRMTVPQGYGPGSGDTMYMGNGGNVFWTIDQSGTEYTLATGAATNTTWWGNYKLQSGTVFLCRPFGGQVSSQAYISSGNPSQFSTGYGVKTRFLYTYAVAGTYDATQGYGYLSMEGATSSKSSNGYLYPYPNSTQKTLDQPSTLIPYTVVSNSSGWDPRTYSIDQMQGVLGNNWEVLRAGDIVNVKFIYIPSGTTVWQKDVVVTGTTE